MSVTKRIIHCLSFFLHPQQIKDFYCLGNSTSASIGVKELNCRSRKHIVRCHWVFSESCQWLWVDPIVSFDSNWLCFTDLKVITILCRVHKLYRYVVWIIIIWRWSARVARSQCDNFFFSNVNLQPRLRLKFNFQTTIVNQIMPNGFIS